MCPAGQSETLLEWDYDIDDRQPGYRPAYVDRILDVRVDISLADGHTVVAKPHFVHHTGIGGVVPRPGSCVGFDWKTVQEDRVDKAAIFPEARVSADNRLAIQGVLVVDVVVDFSNSIVADIGIRESAEEAGGGLAVREKTARAGCATRCRSDLAPRQRQADRADQRRQCRLPPPAHPAAALIASTILYSTGPDRLDW